MSSTTYKSVDSKEESRQEIAIQITKSQLNRFLVFSVILVFGIVDIFAITSNSPLLTDLLIAQAIVLLICIVKFSKSNTVLK